MGTIIKDPFDTDGIQHNSDKYLGRVAVNDIWVILRIRIIDPIQEKGYVDVRERICDATPVSAVRKELSDRDSVIAAFGASNWFNKNEESENFSFEAFVEPINMFLKGVSAALDDDEIRALVCLVFKNAGKWEKKDRIIEALLKHFGRQNRLSYDNDLKMIIDTEVVEKRTVDSIGKYIEQIEILSKHSEGKVYFRGHGELWYKLLLSIFRKKDLYQNERELCVKLIEVCPQEFANMHSHVDMLAEMQHYAMPTRLMDVTSNALVALYFACENESSSAGEVVILDIKNNYRKYYKSAEVIMLSSLAWMDFDEKQGLFEKARYSVKSQKIDKAFEKLKAEVRTEQSYSSLRDELKDLTGYFLISPQKLNRRMVNQDVNFL